MRWRRSLFATAAVTVCTAAPLAANASDLSYTFIDFQAFSTDTAQTGEQVPVPGQTVQVSTENGDGIAIGGAASIARRFYFGGRFQTSIIDVNAVVTNPFGVTTATDTFDLIQSRLAFGYYRELAANFDLTVDLSLDSMEYDFGSFAGENFDAQDDGLGARIGFRWNPRTPLEVYGFAHHSPVGKVDLKAGTFESDTTAGLGLMWYFFGDLGIGIDYASGEHESVAFSMRFSFGDLDLQR